MQDNVESEADARTAVVARLRERRAELVQAIFERVSGDAFGRAGAHDAEYVAGLRAAVAAAVEYVLTGVGQGEGWAGPIPVVAAEQARRAARVGVPLETVLRRYLVGHTLFERFVMDEAARSGENGIPPTPREVVQGALRAQAAVLDRLLETIAAEYGNELQCMGRSPEQRRSERIGALLAGGVVEAAGLEYELEEHWHLGVIARGVGAEEVLRALARTLDRRLLCIARGEGTVWAWLGGRRALEMAALEVAVSSGPRAGVSFAVGEPAKGFEGWRLTHQQAQAALVVALRRPRVFTRYADVALLATALKDQVLARALLDIYIVPLADARGGGPVLLQTLRAYLAAERSVSSAAAALGVDRKTVASRFRTIEKRLGRTLHPCPTELEVALLLDELDPVSAPLEISTI